MRPGQADRRLAADAPAISDAELVSHCQRGRLEAFEQLMERYQDRVFNLVHRLTGRFEDAQDVTQDVFLRAFEHINGFRQQAQVYTWLFRIAVNQAISRRRRDQRLRFVSLSGPGGRAGDDGELAPGGGSDGQLPDVRGERPEAAAVRSEQTERVAEAIATLDEEFRSVLVLKDIEGFDYQEIGQILELPLGTVKSRLHRARTELRRQLAPMMGLSERND